MPRINNNAAEKQWGHEEIQGEIKKCLVTNENGNTTFQVKHSKSRSKRFVTNQACLKKQENRTQSKLACEGTRKRVTSKTQS